MRTLEAFSLSIRFSAGGSPVISNWQSDVRQTSASTPMSSSFKKAKKPTPSIYLIREGRVALGVVFLGRGAVTIETLEGGERLGWSWLIPPNRWRFDARAVKMTRAIALDGKCLRGKCEEDHELGYELVKQVASSLGSALMRHECGSWTFTASPNHLTGYADGYAD